MARIRTIKPELLEDERTARLSHLEWRLFVSLLLLADDYGNLRADPERVRGAALWAFPKDDVAKTLASLVAAELIVLYAVDSQRYAHVVGWSKHQKVDHPGKPLCPRYLPGSSETVANVSRGVRDPLAPDRDRDPDREQDHPIPTPLASPPKAEQIAADAAVYPPEFEEIWSGCDRKGGKHDALKAWKKSKPPAAKVIASWKLYVASLEDWRQPKDVSTWLNARGWLEDYKPYQKPNGGGRALPPSEIDRRP